jgi:hypothetical protein
MMLWRPNPVPRLTGNEASGRGSILEEICECVKILRLMTRLLIARMLSVFFN